MNELKEANIFDDYNCLVANQSIMNTLFVYRLVSGTHKVEGRFTPFFATGGLSYNCLPVTNIFSPNVENIDLVFDYENMEDVCLMFDYASNRIGIAKPSDPVRINV